MIRELTIENFRAFRALHLDGLCRVNLLVGANNSGKTSVLEAIALLASGGDPEELHAALSRRGELAEGDEESSPLDAVDIRHVFFGRKIGDDVSTTITAIDASGERLELRLSTPRVPHDELPEWREAVMSRRRKRSKRSEAVALDLDRLGRTPRFLEISRQGAPVLNVALRLGGGLADDVSLTSVVESPVRVMLIPTTGIHDDDLADFYEKIVLTPEEATVVTALREIEPGIARLATRQLLGERGFVVGMDDVAEQVPLGSLGDGVHRILAIALSLVAARGGYLLVDEIDTGLHHTVMRKMWRLVFETAKRLDVTVFATTHSYDCVHALAAIVRPDERATGEVSLIRIERGNAEGVHFSEAEISHLTEWQIEAR